MSVALKGEQTGKNGMSGLVYRPAPDTQMGAAKRSASAAANYGRA